MPQNILKIHNGRSSFWQWDVNQKLTASWLQVGDKIHITNGQQKEAPVLQAYKFEGVVVVDVPNIMLQEALPISAYRYIEEHQGEEYTVNKFVFMVRQRPKPDSYVYTETEVLTYHALDERIKYLEENGGGGGGGIAKETDPTVSDWAKQPTKPKYTAQEVGALSSDDVDQTYTSNSVKPQSGTAVTEALKTIDVKINEAIQNIELTPGPAGERGVDGKDGLTPFINDKGNWQIGDVDTGVKATGADGSNGNDGTNGENGKDGLTPFINDDGYWQIGDIDTGVKAEGDKGERGNSGVYVGSGEMPDDCNVQIDPEGEVIDMSLYATTEYVDEKIKNINAGEVDLSAFATTNYVDSKIGDIDTALDELHTYAQNLIGGVTE